MRRFEDGGAEVGDLAGGSELLELVRALLEKEGGREAEREREGQRSSSSSV